MGKLPFTTNNLAKRIIIFLIGGLAAFLTTSIQQVSYSEINGWLLINAGISALILFEVMLRTDASGKKEILPAYILGAFILRLPFENFLFGIENSLPFSFFLQILQPQIYFNFIINNFTYSLFFLLETIAVGLSAFYLLTRPVNDLKFNFTSHNTEVYMNPNQDDSTRYLCSSAIILGSTYRNQILKQARSLYTAVAPEIGINIKLVLQVCQFMENREHKYMLWYLGLGFISLILTAALIGPIVFILGSAVIYFLKTYEEQHKYLIYFKKDVFDETKAANFFQVTLSKEILTSISNENQNLVVYNGFSPFVGAGFEINGWSFAIDSSNPAENFDQPESYQIAELYDAIEASCKSLGLSQMRIDDFLFVNGSDIQGEFSILSNMFQRPSQQMDRNMITKYRDSNDFRIRHYKWIKINDWGSQLVFSLFLRCSQRGKYLFVEASRFLLTPIDAKYRQIDGLSTSYKQKTWALGIGSLILGPVMAILAWIRAFAKLSEWITNQIKSEEKRLREEIIENPSHNYGIDQSIRQQFSSSFRYSHYFQKIDREMYVKILDKGILDAILNFLDEKHIDTSEFRDSQTTILNSGIIVQGGNIEAQSVAVGTGARAETKQKLEKSRSN